MNLSVRAEAEELMDADDLAADTYAAVVADLATVNTVTLARRPTLDFLARGTRGLKKFRLLDVGFGDGDMLRAIARWAEKRGTAAELVGVDLNPRSELAARMHTLADLPIRWVTGDYADLAGQDWDFVISSLVAHHMTRDQLVAFLRFMDTQAARGWLVNDLHRHGFAHAGFPILARLLGWHDIVRHDGTLSIARSYRPAEWPPILADAGVSAARVFRAFPFRLCVERLCENPRALIVGGGPAGSVAAMLLARAGSPHLLVERTREAGDALCGGFLSWRTLETLASLGIDADALNRDRVTRVRLFAGDRTAEAALPHPAIAVSRRRLDALLLDRARALGASVERGVAVRGIDGCTAATDSGEVAADALFLASGKHDVRGAARPAAARGADPTLGLRVRLPAHPALDRLIGDAIELHLFDHGYAGLVRQEDGGANLCLAVHRSRFGEPDALLRALAAESPRLGERLAFGHGDTDAVANVPYGWRAAATGAGVFRLGDQAAVIPSLAGEGMGIAVASGIRAARAYLTRGPEAAEAYQRDLYRATRRPVVAAGLVRAAAEHTITAPMLVGAARFAPVLTGLVAKLTRINHSPG